MPVEQACKSLIESVMSKKEPDTKSKIPAKYFSTLLHVILTDDETQKMTPMVCSSLRYLPKLLHLHVIYMCVRLCYAHVFAVLRVVLRLRLLSVCILILNLYLFSERMDSSSKQGWRLYHTLTLRVKFWVKSPVLLRV